MTDFADRLMEDGNDTLWRAGKTIKENEAEIEKIRQTLYKYRAFSQWLGSMFGIHIDPWHEKDPRDDLAALENCIRMTVKVDE